MVANRVGGKSDPYVVLRWNGKVLGETAYKKGNLNPQWSHEIFHVNLSVVNSVDAGPFTLEVYDKDFFTDGDFMGQVVIPSHELWHPLSGVQSSPLQPKPLSSEAIANKIQGNLFYSMSLHHKKQKPLSKLSASLASIMSSPDSSVSTSMVDSNSTSMTVLLAADPTLELQRQQAEGTDFPKMLQRTGMQMDRYLKTPFERTGLISELHYGQLMAAAWRGDHTVLKTEFADMLCIPCGRKGSKVVSETDSNGDQSSAKGNDILCLYLIARFESGLLSKRDMQFFMKLKTAMAESVDIINDRIQRQSNLQSLEKSFKAIASLGDSPRSILAQLLLELQVSFLQCTVRMYLLDPKINYLNAPMHSKAAQFINVIFHANIPTEGTTSDAAFVHQAHVDMHPVSNPNECEFLNIVSRLCRHELVLQQSHRELSVMDLEWVHCTQKSLPSLRGDASQYLSQVEGEESLTRCVELCQTMVEDGMLAIPLLAYREVFMGILMVKGLDKSPQAVYVRDAKSTDTKKEASFKAPEHAVTSFARVVGPLLGEAILQSRIGDICKRIRSFPLQVHHLEGHKSTVQRVDVRAVLTLLVRYVMKQLATSIPAIRQLSIWAVNVSAKVAYFSLQVAEGSVQGNIGNSVNSLGLQGLGHNRGLLSKMSSRMGFSKKTISTPSKVDGKVKLTQLRKLVETSDSVDEEVDGAHHRAVKIQVGCFGEEDIQGILLNCSDEREAIRGHGDEFSMSTNSSEVVSLDRVLSEVAWRVGPPEQLPDDIKSSGGEPSTAAKDSVDFLHAEISRCCKDLKGDVFQLSSGHCLWPLGSESKASSLLLQLFQPHIDEGAVSKVDINQQQQGEGSEQSASDSFPRPSVANSGTGRRASLKPPPPQEAPPKRATSKQDIRCFLAARTPGVGGDCGWGLLGEQLNQQLQLVCQAFEEVLLKLAEHNSPPVDNRDS